MVGEGCATIIDESVWASLIERKIATLDTARITQERTIVFLPETDLAEVRLGVEITCVYA